MSFQKKRDEAMKGTCFLTVHQSRRKKILNKEMFLVLKNYLFLRVSADKFQPPILLFMSLGRSVCKELRQRTHSINSSRSQLREQQFEANIHVRDSMD